MPRQSVGIEYGIYGAHSFNGIATLSLAMTRGDPLSSALPTLPPKEEARNFLGKVRPKRATNTRLLYVLYLLAHFFYLVFKRKPDFCYFNRICLAANGVGFAVELLH